jgi:hypothetical protein
MENRECRECVNAKMLANCSTTKYTADQLKCQVCNQQFKSRNKLFQHIRGEGHDIGKVEDEKKAAEEKKAAASTDEQAIKRVKTDGSASAEEKEKA